MIEVLGLRGCGRRQVPTCACRINLQLHSRPLSPVLASTSSSPSSSLVSFYFSPTALSSFHRHPLLLRSFPRPPLPLPVLTTLDSDYYISFRFSYSSHLALHFVLSLSSPISPINIGYLSVFLFLISACRLLCLFLLKLHPHPASALLPATGFYYLRTLYGATAIIFTAVIVFTRLFRKKESRSIRIVLSLSLPSSLTSDSFINSLTVILSSSRHLPSIVRFFPSASCIVASRRF